MLGFHHRWPKREDSFSRIMCFVNNSFKPDDQDFVYSTLKWISIIDLHDKHEWKVELIDNNFLPHEAKIIKGIPLSVYESQDKQVWLPSNHGEYTTRSAYKLLARNDKNSMSSCSSRERSTQLWKGMWHLQAPYKVKHLIWRAAGEPLPTLHNLLRRGMVKYACCPNCKSDGEDTMHALWSCRRLFVIWELDDELKKLLSKKFILFANFWAAVFMTKDRIDVDLLATVLWLIWDRRNAVRLGEAVNEYQLIRAKAELLQLHFKLAQVLDRRGGSESLRAARQIPPIFPQYKINFDGAVFSEQLAAGLGVVIRDCCGRVIVAMAEHIPVPICGEIVEALACQRALTFARELNISDSVSEGDAEIIIKSLLARDVSHPEYGHVIQDVLFIASGFRVCNFTHVKRLGNSEVHFLAERAKLGNELQVWFESIPNDIAPLF